MLAMELALPLKPMDYKSADIQKWVLKFLVVRLCVFLRKMGQTPRLHTNLVFIMSFDICMKEEATWRCSQSESFGSLTSSQRFDQITAKIQSVSGKSFAKMLFDILQDLVMSSDQRQESASQKSYQS